MIHAARFRDRVTIQRRTRESTAIGLEESYDDLETCWASVNPISHAIRERWRQTDAIVTHEIVFRGDKDLRLDDRFVFKGRILLPSAPPSRASAEKPFTEIVAHEMPEEGSP